jgi:hypothetical protein
MLAMCLPIGACAVQTSDGQAEPGALRDGLGGVAAGSLIEAQRRLMAVPAAGRLDHTAAIASSEIDGVTFSHAHFRVEPGRDGIPATCQSTAPDDQCTVNVCPDRAHALDDVRNESAGVVAISGAAGSSFELVPGADGRYVELVAPGNAYHASEAVTMSAFGSSAVPRFSYQLTFPTPDRVISPAAPTTSFDRNQGITFRWVPDAGIPLPHTIDVSVFQERSFGATRGYVNTLCKFPSTAGVGVVPPSALRVHQPGSVEVSLTPVRERFVKAGSFDVQLIVGGVGQRWEGVLD